MSHLIISEKVGRYTMIDSCEEISLVIKLWYETCLFFIPPEQQPCQMSEDRNVGCLCCVSGPLSVTLYTDRGGYCPGESIGVSAVINNHSNNEIIGLEFHLIQITVYIASTGKQLHVTSM